MLKSLNNIKQFSDIRTRKAELKLDIGKKETEIRDRFESLADMINPVKIVNAFFDNVSEKVKNVARIGTHFLSLFLGGNKRKRSAGE